MGDTPRTDAAAISREFIAREIDRYDAKFVLAEHMRYMERELASLRAEKERAEAERDEAIRMRDRHAEASKAQNEDITALMAERDASVRDAERYRFLVAHSYDVEGVTQFHIWRHEWEPHSKTGEPTEWKSRVRGPAIDKFIDAAIDAARKTTS